MHTHIIQPHGLGSCPTIRHVHFRSSKSGQLSSSTALGMVCSSEDQGLYTVDFSFRDMATAAPCHCSFRNWDSRGGNQPTHPIPRSPPPLSPLAPQGGSVPVSPFWRFPTHLTNAASLYEDSNEFYMLNEIILFKGSVSCSCKMLKADNSYNLIWLSKQEVKMNTQPRANNFMLSLM